MTDQKLDDILGLLGKDFDTLAGELGHSPDEAREVVKVVLNTHQEKANSALSQSNASGIPLKVLEKDKNNILIKLEGVNPLSDKYLSSLEFLKEEVERYQDFKIEGFVEAYLTQDDIIYGKVKLNDNSIAPFIRTDVLLHKSLKIVNCKSINHFEDSIFYGIVDLDDGRTLPFIGYFDSLHAEPGIGAIEIKEMIGGIIFQTNDVHFNEMGVFCGTVVLEDQNTYQFEGDNLVNWKTPVTSLPIVSSWDLIKNEMEINHLITIVSHSFISFGTSLGFPAYGILTLDSGNTIPFIHNVALTHAICSDDKKHKIVQYLGNEVTGISLEFYIELDGGVKINTIVKKTNTGYELIEI